MIVDEPQVQCPFCRGFMPGWLSRYPGKACALCERPLLLVPSLSSARRRSILSALDVAKVIMLPVITGATISFGMGRLGMVKKQVRRGAVARKMSVAKTIFGLFSIVLGTIGLLLVS